MALDFIVIGAGKSGTTSLWSLMREHPGVWMPSSKEVPFFSDRARTSRGTDWLYDSFFSDAPDDAVWGKASPQYMAGKPGSPPQLIAARIRNAIPEVKLIALLRDPIERAISDHRMYVRLGEESDSFDGAAAELLHEHNLDASRWARPGARQYVTQGEYGRTLAPYIAAFGADRVLVEFTVALAEEPRTLLDRVFEFIGVDPGRVSADAGTRLLRGGMRRRISDEAERELMSFLNDRAWGLGSAPGKDGAEAFAEWVQARWSGRRSLADEDVERLGRHLDREVWGAGRTLALADRDAFNWWFSSDWNVIPDDEGKSIAPETRLALERHYRRDAAGLTELLGFPPPWLASWGVDPDAQPADPEHLSIT